MGFWVISRKNTIQLKSSHKNETLDSNVIKVAVVFSMGSIGLDDFVLSDVAVGAVAVS